MLSCLAARLDENSASMTFWTVETVFGSNGGRPGLRSGFSGCSDAIAGALRDELSLEVGDGTEVMEYELAGDG